MKYIDADALSESVNEMMERHSSEKAMKSACLFTMAMLVSTPAADVAPLRHGMWKQDEWDEIDGTGVYKCSVCGDEFVLTEGTPEENEYYFCPHCGARMDANAP